MQVHLCKNEKFPSSPENPDIILLIFFARPSAFARWAGVKVLPIRKLDEKNFTVWKSALLHYFCNNFANIEANDLSSSWLYFHNLGLQYSLKIIQNKSKLVQLHLGKVRLTNSPWGCWAETLLVRSPWVFIWSNYFFAFIVHLDWTYWLHAESLICVLNWQFPIWKTSIFGPKSTLPPPRNHGIAATDLVFTRACRYTLGTPNLIVRDCLNQYCMCCKWLNFCTWGISIHSHNRSSDSNKLNLGYFMDPNKSYNNH